MAEPYIPSHISIAGLAAAYAAGTVRPRDVAAAIISRADRFADWNIWITPPSAELVEPYLERLEAMSPEERSRCPLWGIPFAVKDNIDVAGMATTAGCPAYAYDPAEHAFVVERLVAAGAFPVGKTNLDQFATGLVGTRSPYGECKNAVRPELISGGSSSGSAVAVALGLAAFSLGTDTAGSGRVPAALNGIVGFKPPLGSWSTRGVVPACASLDCVTVFARTLADCRAVDAAARGFDAECSWSRRRGNSMAEDAHAEAVFPRAVLLPADEPRFFGPFADEYRKRWHAAEARLERAAGVCGARVERVDVGWLADIASMLYDGAWVAERWSDLGPFVSAHADEVFPVTRGILESGAMAGLSAADAFSAYHTVAEARARAAALLSDAVLALPTCGGTFTRDEVRADPVATNSLLGLYTNHCNLCDLAAVALPSSEEPADLPFGITLFAAGDAQPMLMAAAERFVGARSIEVAVCGLHMRGYALHSQLEDAGAVFVGAARTAPSYRLFALDTSPVKPGLVRCAANDAGGNAIEVEVYRLTAEAFGAFAASTPAPLAFGAVELENGREVKGFLVEGSAVFDGSGSVRAGVVEITGEGSFRAYLDKRTPGGE